MIGHDRERQTLRARSMRESHMVDRSEVAVYLSGKLNPHFRSGCLRSIVSTSAVMSVNLG